ncbi:tuftelin-like isoform X1 [Anguilla anguilla]|uniref:tuftelin-like isoform X1 n=2 Tax=Anguilla anguilla TaxID=7936 RepID=UPI0015A84CD4|nr:tuftelin-like isoform X1 [Anguilla anguilla]
MNVITRGLCTTVENVETETGTTDSCRRLRLTLHDRDRTRDRPVRTAEQPRVKPRGRAVALVKPPSERQPLKPEPIKPTEEKVEVIKVYLKGRKQEEAQQQSLRMLSDEVSQIQEVRYCLKTLREQMAARNNNSKVEHKFPANGFRVPSPSSQPAAPGHNEEEDEQDWEDENDSSRLREVSKRLYSRLQEAEQRHRAERERLQGQCGQYQQQLSEQTESLQAAQQKAQAQDERVRELQRLLTGMERESADLRAKADEREAELERRRSLSDVSGDQRVEELEKEQAILKEKIHHLDDMLKSQQRKVRHMIEQLQNSRTVIQERDRVIQDLQEKVAYLEAENRELRDRMDFYLGGQNPSSPAQSSSDHRGQIVYSKPLTPNGHANKSLPFIKVIEIKS